jgi:murein DD-endopeptidase MepM/ murein hydrolase activator NlpD
MKLSLPYKTNGCNAIISQVFSMTHQALDFVSDYGTWLVAPEDIVVQKIICADNISTDTYPLERGYGILMSSTSSPTRSHLYWHCQSVFPVKAGDIIKQGQIVARMGNSGFCTVEGKVVPIPGRNKPPYPGTHLHWEVKEGVNFINFQEFIDRSIPITYRALDVIKAIQNIIAGLWNLIKGRK